MKGLYPRNAAELAEDIENLQDGDYLNVEPAIGAYEEEWIAIDVENLVPVKDGTMVLYNIRQVLKNKTVHPHQKDTQRNWISMQ